MRYVKYNISDGVRYMRTNFKAKVTSIATGLGIIGMSVAVPIMSKAVSNIVVSPTNTQGWVSSGTGVTTTPDASVDFVMDNTAPAGNGALRLITSAANTSKAQYMHATDAPVPVGDINELSYYTKQNSASFSNGAPSYQLPTLLNGELSGFTTFVYEPYNNSETITPGSWQSWDVDAGTFWSSQSFSCSNGNIQSGAGGPPFYSLSDIETICPEAVVVGFGANIGTFNPSYNVETDLFNFNGTTYDFEPSILQPHKNPDCNKDAWMTFNAPTFGSEQECKKWVHSKVNGHLWMSGPEQEIQFKGSNNPELIAGGTRYPNKETVFYKNLEYPGGLEYQADVLCTNSNPATNSARLMWQIPEGEGSLSGLYVVAFVTEGKEATSLYGHNSTTDLATAMQWCHTGQGFSPIQYAVERGWVKQGN